MKLSCLPLFFLLCVQPVYADIVDNIFWGSMGSVAIVCSIIYYANRQPNQEIIHEAKQTCDEWESFVEGVAIDKNDEDTIKKNIKILSGQGNYNPRSAHSAMLERSDSLQQAARKMNTRFAAWKIWNTLHNPEYGEIKERVDRDIQQFFQLEKYLRVEQEGITRLYKSYLD
jgi:hypothetical protein